MTSSSPPNLDLAGLNVPVDEEDKKRHSIMQSLNTVPTGADSDAIHFTSQKQSLLHPTTAVESETNQQTESIGTRTPMIHLASADE